ncbi:MAG TPA: regulatory protein RecX [Chitinophagaceae bacterium]|nr:regulatory protein RecX [Chitinophagaceae bacterium]
MSATKKSLNAAEALQKLRHYCGYQERCHTEVREKLYKLEIAKKIHDGIIASLIEEGYLDEERFAIAFAGGKFRVKQWGKQKIRHALAQKQVSGYSINKGLSKIKDDEYIAVLKKLAEEKYESLNQQQWVIRKRKTMDYLLQKGYEPELVNEVLAGVE